MGFATRERRDWGRWKEGEQQNHLESLESIVREGLELVLRKIDREITSVEVRLQRMAVRLGVNNWRELEKVFSERGIDNPEMDLLWPEYLYLRNRLEKLEKRRKNVLNVLAALQG